MVVNRSSGLVGLVNMLLAFNEISGGASVDERVR